MDPQTPSERKFPPRVKSFLGGCMTLEDGASLIGKVWLVLYSIFLGFIVIGGILLLIFGGIAAGSVASDRRERPDNNAAGFLGFGIIATLIIYIIIGLVFGAFVYISLLLVRGVRLRDPSKITPMMVCLAIDTIVSFLSILDGFRFLVQGLVLGCLFGYQFIVLFSVREKFQLAALNGHSTQYHLANQVPPPGGVAVPIYPQSGNVYPQAPMQEKA